MSHGQITEFCGFESLHPAHEWEGKQCPGSEHLAHADHGDDIAAALAAENEGMAHRDDE